MSARFAGIGDDRGGGHGGKGGTRGWLELRGAVGETSGSEGGRVVSSDEAEVGLYSRGARRPSCRRRGYVSGTADACAHAWARRKATERHREEPTGKSRPGSTGRKATATNRAKTPMCVRGHAAVCVGELASGGGEGSIGAATMRSTYWTSSLAVRRREEEGVQRKQCS